jgi:hypothetical protein
MPKLQYFISVTSTQKHSVSSFDILQRLGVLFITLVVANDYLTEGSTLLLYFLF